MVGSWLHGEALAGEGLQAWRVLDTSTSLAWAKPKLHVQQPVDGVVYGPGYPVKGARGPRPGSD